MDNSANKEQPLSSPDNQVNIRKITLSLSLNAYLHGNG